MKKEIISMNFKKEISVFGKEEFIEGLENVLEVKQPKLLKLRKKDLIVIGDLHGDLKSLLHILKTSGFFEDKFSILFLGDYGDRGSQQLEVYFTLFKLREFFPKKTFFLRGNHEYVEGLEVAPHDLPLYLYSKFGYEISKEIYEKI
ncbi:MAG TPA: hypothetical protein ENG63_01635, partial [Candidatus Desulfofervidus auxilii]|nr:hypothetical protein [Candidatus Desulfofervidus auxilii]